MKKRIILIVAIGALLVLAMSAVAMASDQTVYGIERWTGKIYEIDPVTADASPYISLPSMPPVMTEVSPNGLAWETTGQRLYYTQYGGRSILYFWENGSQKKAGYLADQVASATFDEDGHYYYIGGGGGYRPRSDDLYRIDFNLDGTILNQVKLGDIANNLYDWFFDGDIAYNGADGYIYGWGSYADFQYHFFKVKPVGDTFTDFTILRTVTGLGPYSMQIAFGQNGTLYGHRAYDSGDFYTIDLTTGATDLVAPGQGYVFTDLASIPAPTIKYALSGTKFFDANLNHAWDPTPDEPGLQGWTVTLYKLASDNVTWNQVGTDLTDADGGYSFADLAPGTYKVAETQQAGWTQTFPTADDNGEWIVDITSQNVSSLDFGNYIAPGIAMSKDVIGETTVAPYTPVTFTYSVWNTGGVPLSGIAITDDNSTPEFPGDDFDPAPVLAGGFNIGDLNQDNMLDPGETWKYSATVIPPVHLTLPGDPTSSSGFVGFIPLPNGDVRVYFLQDQSINDNTYGTGSDADWKRPHKFKDLTNSDKAGFLVTYADGSILAKFYQDYITATSINLDGYSSWSGYGSLGFGGGDGSFISGNSAVLKDFDTTLEFNLNQPGTSSSSNTLGVLYTAMTVNSPVDDPHWDNTMGYFFTIDAAAFAGGLTMGGVAIFDQHNSPPKTGDDSFTPEITGGTNTATVIGIWNGEEFVGTDDASVDFGSTLGTTGTAESLVVNKNRK